MLRARDGGVSRGGTGGVGVATETPRAKQAWADYLAMGADRSLTKLLARYESANESPTKRFKTLADWSRTFGWQRRLDEIAEQEQQAIVRRGIADKQNRVDALNDRHRRMREVIEARANDPENAKFTGGTTGLMVREPVLVKFYEATGTGDDDELIPTKQTVLVEKAAVDTGLLAEMRATEKQAAQELGQWIEKGELTGKDGAALFKVYQGLDPEKV